MPPTQLFHPSPKRKRDQPPQVPLLNTALRPASQSPAPSSGGDSPRNAVADQLRGMTLTAISAIPMSPLTPTDDVIRKKPKLEAMREDSATSLEDFTEIRRESRGSDKSWETIAAKEPASQTSKEIPETPQTQPRIPSDFAAFARPTSFTSLSTSTAVQEPTKSNQSPKSQSRSSQPRQRKKSPSPPLSALTWQDSEITGHLVDPSKDPEDDGTGLNGIGFKPTPAIAYARSQKRRQQVMDWKAREAREARAKRSERRRRGVGGTASREATVEREMTANEGNVARRIVKFAI